MDCGKGVSLRPKPLLALNHWLSPSSREISDTGMPQVSDAIVTMPSNSASVGVSRMS